MSYTYLQEQAGESLVECSSDIPQFALLKLNHIAEKSCCNASETESCQGFQYGTISEHSTGIHGADALMPCAVDSLAKTYPQQAEADLDSMEKKADFGAKCGGWFAKFSPGLFSWKTRQPSLFEDWEESWLTWPRWGMMQDGVCFRLEMLEHDTSVREYGLSQAIGTPIKSQRCRSELFMNKAKTPFELCPKGYLPCPTWVERLMGWPIGWTDLQPLEMDKFRKWLLLHGGC